MDSFIRVILFWYRVDCEDGLFNCGAAKMKLWLEDISQNGEDGSGHKFGMTLPFEEQGVRSRPNPLQKSYINE